MGCKHAQISNITLNGQMYGDTDWENESVNNFRQV